MDRRLLYAAIAIIVVGAIYTYNLTGSAEFNGLIGTGFKINYEDGTTLEVDPFTNSFLGIFNTMSVRDSSGTAVSTIEWYTNTKVGWTGERTSHAITGTIKIYVNDVQKAIYDISYSSTLNKDTLTRIKDALVSSSDLEDWAGDATSATFKVVSELTVTMNFADGETSSMSGTGTGKWNYTIDNESSAITSLSVTSTVGKYGSSGVTRR